MPIEVIRKREIKWLDMFQNWEKWMSKRFKKVIISPAVWTLEIGDLFMGLEIFHIPK